MNPTIERLREWLQFLGEPIVAVSRWLGSHATRASSIIRAYCYMAVGLNWYHLDNVQIALIMGLVEALLMAFTETNTVSKKRMGERIDEVEVKADAKVDARVDAKVEELTGIRQVTKTT